MRSLLFIFVILSGMTFTFSQEVTVTATTNKREIARILNREREAGRINRAFFSEHDRCRSFLAGREWAKAESSCRLAILRVEKLPKEHVLERASARTSLAIALLWQDRPKEALVLLNKSLAIRKTVVSESDGDTGDLYVLFGNAYSQLDDIRTARGYYERAEKIYRAAIVEIDDDWLRISYSRRLRNTVKTHYNVVTWAGLVSEAEKLQVRLAHVEKEFAQYLRDQSEN